MMSLACRFLNKHLFVKLVLLLLHDETKVIEIFLIYSQKYEKMRLEILSLGQLSSKAKYTVLKQTEKTKMPRPVPPYWHRQSYTWENTSKSGATWRVVSHRDQKVSPPSRNQWKLGVAVHAWMDGDGATCYLNTS